MTTGIAAQNVQLGSASTFVVAKTINVNQYHPITSSMGSIGFDLLTQNVATAARRGCGEMAAVRRCHRGTRVDILKELREWATSTSYPFPIKWINGSVAVGKSTIVETMCQYLSTEGLLMAAFLFPRTGDCRNGLTQAFIPTLAYELSISIPGARPYIERAIEKDPLIFSQSLEVQTQVLITSPLLDLYRTNLLPALCPRVIVVDGVDECGGEKQEEILRTLIFICRHIPFPLAILVASRPEPCILNLFNRHDLCDLSERLVLDGSSRDAHRDIQKYYEDNFGDIRLNHRSRRSLPSGWPSEDHIDLLVRRTSGQFGFAAAVVGFVMSIRHNPALQLDIILRRASTPKKSEAFSPLDRLYITILRNIELTFRSGTIRILGVLLVLTDELSTLSLTSTSIERLLHLEAGDAQGLLFDIQSLIQVEPESSRLTIAHDSFREFLLDESRANDLHVDPPAVYEDLLKNAIFLLMDGVEEDLQDLLDNILTFPQKADPTPDLHACFERGIENIEKIYYSNNNRRLVHCILFYEAVKSSKLKDANILSERILESYTRLLSKSIYRYRVDDPSITCLILASRFGGEHEEDECLHQLILDIFSRFPAIHKLDLENGLRLRDMVPSLWRQECGFSAIRRSDPILRAMELLRTTISRLVGDMTDRDQHYSMTARYLLGYMFIDSPHHVPALRVLSTAPPTLRKLCFSTVLPHVFPEILAGSAPDPELFQYIIVNKLSDDYQGLEAIANAIQDYVERTTEALKLSSPPSVIGADIPLPQEGSNFAMTSRPQRD